MILKLLLAVLILGIIPELLGLLMLRLWKKEKTNLVLGLILGYILEFTIGELLSVPMILIEYSYSLFLKLYVIIILAFSAVSLIITIFNLKNIFETCVKVIKEIPKVFTVLVMALVIMQIFVYIGPYMHTDDDDAYYVGSATTTIETNTLFKYSPTTGGTAGEQLAMRYRLGPFPIYYAILSSLLKIHPALIAHEILPAVFLSLVYLLYYVIGYELFDKNIKKATTFVFFMSLLNIFGNYSNRTVFSFLLFRIWQGKSLLANLILPLTMILIIKFEKDEQIIIPWFNLILTVIAGVFTTTMGIALTPIVIMSLAFVYAIKDKSLWNFIKSGICVIPAMIYGIMYFMY